MNLNLTSKALRPIQTEAYGHKFRSRLEARVAVFLSNLPGCHWLYEPEGFDLPETGKYLPDFLVQGFPTGRGPVDFWLEVKGVEPTIPEINRLRELCVVTGRHGYFAVGNRKQGGQLFKDLVKASCPLDAKVAFLWLTTLTHCQAPVSRFVPIPEDGGRHPWKTDSEMWAFFRELDDLRLQIGDEPRALYESAAKAALSARFEFGEAP